MALVGEGAIVTNVLPDVFPTLELEDLPGELYKLAGWDIAVGAESLSPGAINRATIGLENPVGSGKIAVLTRLRFQPDLSASSPRRSPLTKAVETNTSGTGLSSPRAN